MLGSHTIPHCWPLPMHPSFGKATEDGGSPKRNTPKPRCITSLGKPQETPQAKINDWKHLIEIGNRMHIILEGLCSPFQDMSDVLFPGEALVLSCAFEPRTHPFEGEEFAHKEGKRA